ncbi:MAG TPA: hypothetical protein VF773_06420 [Verrucomicrobiae bacterium]
MKQFLLSKLIGWFFAILAVVMIFVAGWVLQLIGKDNGRWESFTMFLPAVMLFLSAHLLQRFGRRAVDIYLMSGLFLVFGLVVLFMG